MAQNANWNTTIFGTTNDYLEAREWPLAAGRLFEAAEQRFIASQRLFPYASPWLEADIDETDALMGGQPHAHGLAVNRATLEAFCDQAFRSGLVARKVAVDELFAELGFRLPLMLSVTIVDKSGRTLSAPAREDGRARRPDEN